MKKHLNLTLMLTTLLTLLFLAANVMAIPAFARRYKISCSTCHSPMPKLKPYGDEFAGNGFIIKEEENKRNYVSAGDDLLWLNKDFPIAVRFDAFAQYEQDQFVEKDLQTPWGIKLLSGGALYKNIGYYFYFYMSERGEVAGIEDAYIHFDNVGDTNFDIMVGQFQTSDPLMKRELRLTVEDYMIYKTSVGHSNTNLAYDRGIMVVYGIEKTGTDLVGMLVNGNGKDEAGNDKKFDNDSNKNIGFRLNQGIGEYFSIGGLYYKGNEELEATTLSSGEKNEITYLGTDFNIGIGPVEVTGQYLKRKDTNPFFDSVTKDIECDGIILETVISPKLDRSRVYFTLLYNKIKFKSDQNNNFTQTLENYETATFSSTFLIARNLRIIGEYTRNLEYDKNIITLGLVSAF